MKKILNGIQAYLDLKILNRVLTYAHKYKKLFALTAVLTIVLGFLTPIRPYLIQYTIDNFVIIPDEENLLKFTLLIVFILLIEAIFQFYQTFNANLLAQNVLKDIRHRVFNKIVHFKLKIFDTQPIGRLVTRVISDIEAIAEIFSQGILIIIGDLLKLIMVIALMFYTHWQLALLSLASVPLLLWATDIFKRSVKKAFQEVRKQVSQLNTFVQEHVIGMYLVQIFNREKQEMEKFKEINEKHKKAHIQSVWAYSVFFPVVEVLNALSIALVVWWGATSVLQGEVTFGILVAFILYIHMLFRPIRQLADRFNTLQMGMVAAERVFQLLDKDEAIQNNGKIKNIDIQGHIKTENLWFRYKEDEWILKGISFEIFSGETVAIVGATGAGKSSLASVLMRFYEYQKGSVYIDNQKIEDYDLQFLRKNISLVLQDVFLFSDTIFNNITLKDPSVNKQQVIDAAKKVGAHEFIMKLPGNYNFNVKERGGTLSTGQRQLIAFIRAYLYNPKILILDEATSSIDTETEQLIQYATEQLTQGRTSIIIAHRLATIKNADKILVMDKGKIIECGTHEELIRIPNGFYQQLFKKQFLFS